MRTVEFEGEKYRIKITGENFIKLQRNLAPQLLNYKRNEDEVKSAQKKAQELLVEFKSSVNKRHREKIARKIAKLEKVSKDFAPFVNSFQTLHLFICAYSMLEPVHGKRKYDKWWHIGPFKKRGYRSFIRMADLEEIKKIEDDLLSVVAQQTKEDYVKEKEKAQKKELNKRKKKVKELKARFTQIKTT